MRVKYLAHTGSPVNNSSYPDLPGGPAVKTPCFHCRADGSTLAGELGPTCHKAQVKKIEKERKKATTVKDKTPLSLPDSCELDTWVWDRLSPRILHRHAAHTPTQADAVGHPVTSGKHTCQGH